MRQQYQLSERLRVATLATFISGFINAYTFTTQGGSFAGVQSGNLLMLAIHLAQGHWHKLWTYLLPLLFFCFGQGASYVLRRYAKWRGYRWHVYVSGVLFVLMTTIAIFSPHLPQTYTLAGLALFASIKVDTFKRVRDMTYASVMMTGNIKNMAHHLVKGLVEKDQQLLKQAFYTLLVLLACFLGAVASTLLAPHFHEHSLYFLLFPLVLLWLFIYLEKPIKIRKKT